MLNGATSTVKAELAEMQVENGTKASGWNPSPEETMERIYEASREASDHFWIKTTNPDSGMYISKLPLTEDIYASRAGGNIVLTSNGMDIYNGTTKLATYGSSTLFYIPGTTDVATTLNSTGLNTTSGSIELGTLSQPDYMYLGPNGFSLYNKLKYDPDTGLLQLNVDKVAEEIIKGIEKKKTIITVDWKYRILVFFWNLVPRWIWVRMNIVSKKL